MRRRLTALAAAAGLLLLAAVAGPVGAAPLDEATRQSVTELYTCGFLAGSFHAAAEIEPVSDEDKALAERGMAAVDRMANYFEVHDNLRISPADFEVIRTEIKDRLTARLAPFEGLPDAPQKLRDTFRADLQACIDRAEALPAP